jgi:hypothetical protein
MAPTTGWNTSVQALPLIGFDRCITKLKIRLNALYGLTFP